MKSFRVALILVLAAGGALAALQRSGMANPAGNLRVSAPENGQKIATSFVDVHYQLVNPAAQTPSTPTFQLQLDGGDPVQTAASSYTFTGLKPGEHAVLVEAVDANNSPIANAIIALRFVVLPLSPAGGPQSKLSGPIPQMRATALQPQQSAGERLPQSGSALPLLSIIGFGVLMGGIASALKTR